MKIRLNNLRALKWMYSHCNNNYKRNTFFWSNLKFTGWLSRTRTSCSASADYIRYYCSPLCLFISSVSDRWMKWEWGRGGNLKTCYPKYNNFLLIKTTSKNNSRDISMSIGNRSLYRTDMMQSAAKHVKSILQDVHFITQTSPYSPHASSERRMGYCLLIQKLRSTHVRKIAAQEKPIVGTKSVF